MLDFRRGMKLSEYRAYVAQCIEAVERGLDLPSLPGADKHDLSGYPKTFDADEEKEAYEAYVNLQLPPLPKEVWEAEADARQRQASYLRMKREKQRKGIRSGH
jgi:hypothetical protein